MKTEYDITKLYVGLVARQSEVKYSYYWGMDTLATWGFSDFDVKIFTKTPFGFKSVITGEYYKKATHKTGGEMVIAHDCIYRLAKYDADLIKFYLKEAKTTKIKVEEKGKLDIDGLENYFNQTRQKYELIKPFIKEEGRQKIEEILDKVDEK